MLHKKKNHLKITKIKKKKKSNKLLILQYTGKLLMTTGQSLWIFPL